MPTDIYLEKRKINAWPVTFHGTKPNDLLYLQNRIVNQIQAQASMFVAELDTGVHFTEPDIYYLFGYKLPYIIEKDFITPGLVTVAQEWWLTQGVADALGDAEFVNKRKRKT
jgi:hypothetical protein